ncbi:unannotated protein [freshwater metagenome]|uniref:Unannotated protein n=1 Tax=freshwater metagenome TaxID=449393 RepID=A0A6J7JIH8_9ZZZZ
MSLRNLSAVGALAKGSSETIQRITAALPWDLVLADLTSRRARFNTPATTESNPGRSGAMISIA